MQGDKMFTVLRKRLVAVCIAAAFIFSFICSNASTVPNPGAWQIPAKYRGYVVRSRVRYFPKKILALTFDDGPDSVNTPKILAELRLYHAHATFFCIGQNVLRHPELVKQEYDDGNAIGNHSFTHPAHPSASQAKVELDKTEQAIQKACGKIPICYRPPYGILQNELTREAKARGYAVILWTISSADTRPVSSTVLANNVIHTPCPGDIILFHDGAGHKRTPLAVSMVLDQLSRAGYKFVTVPELLREWAKWESEKNKR
jgi:chitin deacetylase